MILQIFWNKKFLLVKSNFLQYCDVYEHGKLGISVTTSLIIALVKSYLCLYFQTNCQPHITEAAKSSVEGICKKIYNLSCDYAQKIQEKNSEILKEHGISGMKISR